MDQINVMFDSIEINCSQAKDFFRKHEHIFSGIKSGNVLNKDGPKKNDDAGNIIYTSSIEKYMYFYDKNGWDMKKNVDTLKKIAHALEKKSSLIAEIEYSVRKVLPEHTKKYLKNAIQYFEYCADCILLTKNIIIEDTSSYPVSNYLYFDENKQLWEVLYEIGLLLISGYQNTVKLHASVNTTAVSVLLCELFLESGLPRGTLSILPTEDLKNNSEGITEKGTIFVIFEKCDLDSAVDCLVKTLYPFDYCSPLYLKQIFVQESIMEHFEKKLKDKIIKLETSYPKNFKITTGMNGVLSNLKNVLKFVVDNNIKHIPMPENFYGDDPQYAFKPLILVDNCVEDNFWESKVDKRYQLPVGLQAFRTTKEVLNLVKKNSCYAISIWCDNSSTSDEAALSADVECVWINSYGQMSAPIGWNIDDGYPVIMNSKFLKFIPTSDFEEFKPIEDKTYEFLVDKSTKLQEKWQSLSSYKKMSIFMKAKLDLEKNKDILIEKFKLDIKETEEEDEKNSIDKILKYFSVMIDACKNVKNNLSLIDRNRMRIEIAKPLGIIGVGGDPKFFDEFICLVIALAVYGNSIILSTNSPIAIEICEILSNSGLPVSYFKTNQFMSPMKYDAIKCFLYIREGDGNYIKFLKNDRFMIDFSPIINFEWEHLPRIFSQQKLIWKTYGETFAL